MANPTSGTLRPGSRAHVACAHTSREQEGRGGWIFRTIRRGLRARGEGIEIVEAHRPATEEKRHMLAGEGEARGGR